jgi:hypothetical protein
LGFRRDKQVGFRRDKQVRRDKEVDFNILTALKGWVGLAPEGPGALHIIIIWLTPR